MFHRCSFEKNRKASESIRLYAMVVLAQLVSCPFEKSKFAPMQTMGSPQDRCFS